MMMMNLVWGRAGANVPLDLVWQAVLGVTDQYQRTHISSEYYEEVCANLRVSGTVFICPSRPLSVVMSGNIFTCPLT